MAIPHGKLVKVKGKNMHVRQMGSSGKTIVLLPGLNDPLPSVEFAPLMRELSKKYTVCIVEFFGYGHSDSTDTPRTNENYVSEMREALILTGLNPPYVLMPYSASGIYAEYYAAKYPQEIEGLILLDSTPTVESFAKEFAYTDEDIQEMNAAPEDTEEPEYDQNAVDEAIEYYMRHGYTLEELGEIDEIENHVDTITAQELALSDNIFEVLTLPIPKNIPILAFNSDINELLKELELNDESLSENEKQLEAAKYKESFKGHMDRLGEHAKFVVIEKSNHADIAYNRDYRKIISSKIDTFFGQCFGGENTGGTCGND